jgi:hypothetical protein
MTYKILEAHIAFNFDQSTIVSVAIQSDIKERHCTHFKAYYGNVPPNAEISNSALQLIAAAGTKYSSELAKEIFPNLRHLNYY